MWGYAGWAVLPAHVSEGPSDDTEKGGTGQGRGDFAVRTPALTLSKHLSPLLTSPHRRERLSGPPGAALQALLPS